MLPRFHFGTGFLELGLPPVAVGCSWLPSWFRRRRWFLDGRIPFSFLGFFFVVVGRVVESIFFGGGPGRQPAVGLAVATRVDGFVSSVFIGRTNQPTDRPTNRKETTTMTTTTTTTTTTTKKQKRPNGRRRFLFGRGPWNRFYRVFFSRVLPSFFLLF